MVLIRVEIEQACAVAAAFESGLPKSCSALSVDNK